MKSLASVPAALVESSERDFIQFWSALLLFATLSSQGLVPALKGSAVGLGRLIDVSVFVADAAAQALAGLSVFLGILLVLPTRPRLTHFVVQLLAAAAILLSSLLVILSARIEPPTTWSASVLALSGIATLALLPTRHGQARLSFLGAGLRFGLLALAARLEHSGAAGWPISAKLHQAIVGLSTVAVLLPLGDGFRRGSEPSPFRLTAVVAGGFIGALLPSFSLSAGLASWPARALQLWIDFTGLPKSLAGFALGIALARACLDALPRRTSTTSDLPRFALPALIVITLNPVSALSGLGVLLLASVLTQGVTSDPPTDHRGSNL